MSIRTELKLFNTFAGALSKAVVVWCMFDWFVMPLSPAIPYIGFWHAFGLIMVVNLLSSNFRQSLLSDQIAKASLTKEELDKTDMAVFWAVALTVPLALGIAYIVKIFAFGW